MRNRRLRLAGLLLALAVAPGLPGAAAQAPPFRQARPGYRFDFPRDHFAHPEFQTEWWYYTGNLRTADGRRFGFELTFFRQAAGERAPAAVAALPGDARVAADRSPWDIGDVYLAHFAVSDVDGRRFYQDERVNRAGPGLAGADAATGTVWNGNWAANIDGNRHRLEAVSAAFRLRLDLASRKAPVINGVDGVSQKGEDSGQASHYVSLTRLLGRGRLVIGSRAFDVDASAWMDHEFFTSQLGRDQRGWDWMGLQLDDNSELLIYRLRRADGTADRFSSGTLVGADGRTVHLRAEEFSLAPLDERWSSPDTRATYPVAWRVTIPSRRIELTIRAPLVSQEIVARSGLTPSYWEGAVTVTGSRDGAGLTGVGYLEMTGYAGAVVLGR
jgi:predicted secreted hydrolase